MVVSEFDFQQKITKLSDKISYPPINKSEKFSITPETFITVWCDNNHPTTERASRIYTHIMDNGLLFNCPVCKLNKELENDKRKPAQVISPKVIDSFLQDANDFSVKIYIDFAVFFVLLVIILFYFTF